MELEILRWLRDRLPQSSRVLVGPGDDAAIVDWSGVSRLLVACDTIVEGLDFTLDTCSVAQVGRKALAINLSDLAAMAATPVAATVSIVLPHTNSLGICQELVEGMLLLAESAAVDLVGGDISIWDGPLIITVNVTGQPGEHGSWTRRGATAGDTILVTGRLGGSILGHHLTFRPRLAESQLLSTDFTVKAAIDISDGLAIDTYRLASENGLQAILDLASIPISESAVSLARSEPTGLTALEHALQDGEDFELLLAVGPSDTSRILSDPRLDFPISAIGTFQEGAGLWSRDASGLLEPLAPAGYVHGVLD